MRDESVLSLCGERNGGALANRLRRRTSDQTVLGSNPAVAAARCVESLDKALYSHCPKEPSHCFYCYLAILVNIYWRKKKQKKTMQAQVVRGRPVQNGLIDFFPPAIVNSQIAQVDGPKILEQMVFGSSPLLSRVFVTIFLFQIHGSQDSRAPF